MRIDPRRRFRTSVRLQVGEQASVQPRLRRTEPLARRCRRARTTAAKPKCLHGWSVQPVATIPQRVLRERRQSGFRARPGFRAEGGDHGLRGGCRRRRTASAANGAEVPEAAPALRRDDTGAETQGVTGGRSAPLASLRVQHGVGWLPATKRSGEACPPGPVGRIRRFPTPSCRRGCAASPDPAPAGGRPRLLRWHFRAHSPRCPAWHRCP